MTEPTPKLTAVQSSSLRYYVYQTLQAFCRNVEAYVKWEYNVTPEAISEALRQYPEFKEEWDKYHERKEADTNEENFFATNQTIFEETESTD